MAGKRRKLSPEENALWEKVAKSARPMRPVLPGKPARALPLTKKDSAKPAPTAETRAPIAPFRIGEMARPDTRLPDTPAPRKSTPVHRKTAAKMKRGQLRPEARIDLHGMTQDEAHPALTGFILRSASMGRRMVLVITGKGRDRDSGGPIPERMGVLRQVVPGWLQSGQLAGIVVDVVQAHQRHGGEGAYYVYLRRMG